MRATFPNMLAASLVVHGLIAGAVALSLVGAGANQLPRAEIPKLSLVWLKPQPVRPHAVALRTKHAATRELAMSAPAALASIPTLSHVVPAPAPKPAAIVATTAPSGSVHPEQTNPVDVLAPVPAPRLDGTKGVVFVLDGSGSMAEPYAGSSRLAFARADLSERVRALADGTPFAVVIYAARACVSGPLVAANDATRAAAVRFLMRDMNTAGEADLPGGLAAARALKSGALVLATDGNLDIPGPDLMLQAREILGERGTGPSILILGIAPRPDTSADHLLQDLADLEGGTYEVEQTADETALR